MHAFFEECGAIQKPVVFNFGKGAYNSGVGGSKGKGRGHGGKGKGHGNGERRVLELWKFFFGNFFDMLLGVHTVRLREDSRLGREGACRPCILSLSSRDT
jgi:hypothetical protein